MTAPTSLQGRLNNLINIADTFTDTNGTYGVIVSRHKIANSEGYIFSVTFKGESVDGDLPLLTLAYPSTLGGENTTDDSSLEQVSIALVKDGMMGGYKVVYDQVSTTCIGWKSPLNFQEKLAALTPITTAMNVAVTHEFLPTGVSRYVISLENDVSVGVIKKFGISYTSCPALDASVVDNSIPSFGLYANGQTYKLQFQVSGAMLGQNDASAYITEPINWLQGNHTAADSLQSRLNALPNIANNAEDPEKLGVIVTRSTVTDLEGFVYSITFIGHRVHGNVSPLSIAENTLGQTITADNLNIAQNTEVEGKMISFKLSYSDASTNSACIGWDTRAHGDSASMRNRLVALPSVPDTLIVTKGDVDHGRRFVVGLPLSEYDASKTFKADVSSCTGFSSDAEYSIIIATEVFDSLLVSYFTIDHQPLMEHENLNFQINNLLNPIETQETNNITIGLLTSDNYVLSAQTDSVDVLAIHHEIIDANMHLYDRTGDSETFSNTLVTLPVPDGIIVSTNGSIKVVLPIGFTSISDKITVLNYTDGTNTSITGKVDTSCELLDNKKCLNGETFTDGTESYINYFSTAIECQRWCENQGVAIGRGCEWTYVTGKCRVINKCLVKISAEGIWSAACSPAQIRYNPLQAIIGPQVVHFTFVRGSLQGLEV
jgi:hypothetical protein